MYARDRVLTRAQTGSDRLQGPIQPECPAWGVFQAPALRGAAATRPVPACFDDALLPWGSGPFPGFTWKWGPVAAPWTSRVGGRGGVGQEAGTGAWVSHVITQGCLQPREVFHAPQRQIMEHSSKMRECACSRPLPPTFPNKIIKLGFLEGPRGFCGEPGRGAERCGKESGRAGRGFGW